MGRPKKETIKEGSKFVGKEEFESFATAVLDRLEALKEKKVDVPETKEEKEVAAAVPNKYTTNPEWEEMAKDILGNYLDHTEVEHEKTGGIKFTVVIKKEVSNASKEYIERHGIDRRTKEVGTLGMDGVTEWCKLIRANLKRSESN